MFVSSFFVATLFGTKLIFLISAWLTVSHLLLTFRYLKFLLPVGLDILYEDVNYICLKEKKTLSFSFLLGKWVFSI